LTANVAKTFFTNNQCISGQLVVSASGGVQTACFFGSGSTLLSVDGSQGRLLEVTDDLSCSIFSANTIAGLPVIEAFSNYCVSLGQYNGHKFEVTCTSIRGGKCSTASGKYSFVGGGCCNTASNYYSFVGEGTFNTASGVRAVIVNGAQNCASANCSIIVGGSGNTASSGFASIVGGANHTASGYGSFIGGGLCNRVTTTYSTISGGRQNCANNTYSFIGGGYVNCATNTYTTISGGYSNVASGQFATISGGYNGLASCDYTSIGGGHVNCATYLYGRVGGGFSNCVIGCSTSGVIAGGQCNTISGYSYNSGILGGCANTISGYASAFIIGTGLTASAANTTHIQNLCASGCAWAVAYYCTSDERLKNVKQRYSSFDNINPVQYSWKEGDPSIFHYGYTAQNVQQTLPNAVTCNNKGVMSVDYSQVHTYKIMKLEEKIQQLTQELNDIKSLLTK